MAKSMIEVTHTPGEIEVATWIDMPVGTTFRFVADSIHRVYGTCIRAASIGVAVFISFRGDVSVHSGSPDTPVRRTKTPAKLQLPDG